MTRRSTRRVLKNFEKQVSYQIISSLHRIQINLLLYFIVGVSIIDEEVAKLRKYSLGMPFVEPHTLSASNNKRVRSRKYCYHAYFCRQTIVRVKVQAQGICQLYVPGCLRCLRFETLNENSYGYACLLPPISLEKSRDMTEQFLFSM